MGRRRHRVERSGDLRYETHPERVYVADFCEDLNHKGIILHVDDDLFADDGAMGRLRESVLVRARLGKGHRLDSAMSGNRCFYVANCDVNDCDGPELPRLLLDGLYGDQYRLFHLRYDGERDAFYYEMEEEECRGS